MFRLFLGEEYMCSLRLCSVKTCGDQKKSEQSKTSLFFSRPPASSLLTKSLEPAKTAAGNWAYIDVAGSSDITLEELWSGRKVKSCFGNLSLSCIPKLSRSVHSWTDHALVHAEWIKNSQFPLRDAPARSHGNCIHHLGLDICFDEYSAGMSQRGNSPLMLQYNYNITAHSSSGQFSYVSACVYELNITN